MDDSNSVKDTDFEDWYRNAEVKARWNASFMGPLWPIIGGALDQETAKALALRKHKEQEKRVWNKTKKKQKTESSSESDAASQFAQPVMSTISPPRSAPSSMTTETTILIQDKSPITHHKKTPSNITNITDSTEHSLLSESTDTMPRALEQPGAYVQDIQNTFVRCVFNILGWTGGIPITWAQGREMWLDYASFHPMINLLT